MAHELDHVHIEKISLLDDERDIALAQCFSDDRQRDPQMGRAWLENLSRYALERGDQAVVYIAKASPEDFVACPMLVKRGGRNVQSLSTFYTSLYAPIIQSQTPQLLLTALFRHLSRNEKFSQLILAPLDSQDPVFTLMLTAQENAGWRGVHQYFCFGNWIHDLPDADYDAYLKTRPSRLRNTVRRRTQKFLAMQDSDLQIIHGGDSLDAAIAQYTQVYENSWKQNEPFPEFTPNLLKMSAAMGWLRLGIASLDSVPVAAQIWLVKNRTAYIFKLAYDENYKQLSPGTVLTAFMMERVLGESAIDRIDYLSGDDAYKRDWMSARRERHGIAAYNPRTVAGIALLWAHHLKRLTKIIRRQPDSAN